MGEGVQMACGTHMIGLSRDSVYKSWYIFRERENYRCLNVHFHTLFVKSIYLPSPTRRLKKLWHWWRNNEVSCRLSVCYSSSDIKPENLLISSDDVLKLCDFGERIHNTLRAPTELEGRWRNGQNCDVNGVFWTRAIFGWDQSFSWQQAGFIRYLKPSLQVLSLLQIPLSFQLMKHTG